LRKEFQELPRDDINTAIENAGKLEIYKLEKNVSMLATISGAGPMTGFLGTVVGMIQAFIKWQVLVGK
jgi:biopolymer transport protein ExbB